jgi:hypothetical protein
MQPTRLNTHTVAASALAFGLWLVTTAAAMVEVYLLRQAYVRVAIRLGVDVSTGIFGADILVLVLALVWIAFTLGTGEFHRKYVGQPRSWRLFAWTAGIEAALFLFYLVA